jgi:isoleucyl-tRNA synthetase
MSDNVMTQLSEAYRKLRNTFRFALGNLAGFDPARDAVPDAEMEELDRWMLSRTAELVAQCSKWYEGFEFHRVFHALHDFAVVDLSAFYFDVLKDRLYTFAARNRTRRSAQTAVYRIAKALLNLATPIMVFTSEEIWRHFPHVAGDPESAHLALFPSPKDVGAPFTSAEFADFKAINALRSLVLHGLEAARNAKTISGSLEAKVRIRAEAELGKTFRKYAGLFPALFIVSQVEFEQTPNGTIRSENPLSAGSRTLVDDLLEILGPLEITISRADGAKCERCWNYSTHVGENADYPTVCERCVKALNEIEESGQAGGQGAASA